jgi:hypothetical protein
MLRTRRINFVSSLVLVSLAGFTAYAKPEVDARVRRLPQRKTRA